MREDVGFYVDVKRLASGGPVLELAVGTGRIAVPTAKAGVQVIGRLDECPRQAPRSRRASTPSGKAWPAADPTCESATFATPPVSERVPLVTIPFRSPLHMLSDAEKTRALAAARALLEPGGPPASTSSPRAART